MNQESTSRRQDLGLSVITLSAGPLLILCGSALAPTVAGPAPNTGPLGAVVSQSFADLRRSSLQTLDEVMGLAAVAGGVLLTLLTLGSVLMAAAAVVSHRVGALRAEHLFNSLSPSFMRRTLIVTLSAHLAVGGLAASPALAHAVPPADQGIAADAPPAPTFITTSPASPISTISSTSPTSTASPTSPTDPASTAETEASMTPLFTPTAPAAPAERHQGAGQRTDPGEEDRITVRPGDTLWGLVSAELGPGATDWEIAREWPRWYELNAAPIGDDPGTLAPGIVLDKPPAAR